MSDYCPLPREMREIQVFHRKFQIFVKIFKFSIKIFELLSHFQIFLQKISIFHQFFHQKSQFLIEIFKKNGGNFRGSISFFQFFNKFSKVSAIFSTFSSKSPSFRLQLWKFHQKIEVFCWNSQFFIKNFEKFLIFY